MHNNVIFKKVNGKVANRVIETLQLPKATVIIAWCGIKVGRGTAKATCRGIHHSFTLFFFFSHYLSLSIVMGKLCLCVRVCVRVFVPFCCGSPRRGVCVASGKKNQDRACLSHCISSGAKIYYTCFLFSDFSLLFSPRE
jgi:hypothetical protein